MKGLAVVFAVITVSLSALLLPAKAERVCQVTDPTGTPLNVRDTPMARLSMP